MLVHATAVVRHGHALLLSGPPGVGKSDLALRLLDRGWSLIADDYVRLIRHEGRLIARAPEATRGLIEVRGLGLVGVDPADPAPVAMEADLGLRPDRLPDPVVRHHLGVAVPVVALDPAPPSAPIKLELAFARALEALKRAAP